MTGINIAGVAVAPSTVLLTYGIDDFGPPPVSTPGMWALTSPAFAPQFVTADGWAYSIASPDGSKIAFDNSNDLYIINADGSGEALLDTFAPSAMSWHPDGTNILYRVGATIRTVKPDGSDLTDLIFKSSLFQPVYNFDGSRIAFYVEKSGSTPDELWIMDADGSNATKVADGINYPGGGPGSRGQIGALAWARTQDVLAYYKTDGGAPPSTSVWLINGDGTGETQITPSGTNFVPGRWAWPSDDSVIAGYAAAGVTLYTVDPSGVGGATSLGITRWNAGGGGPEVWADRIFYIGGTNEANVMSCALDGSDIRQHDGDDLATVDTSLFPDGR